MSMVRLPRPSQNTRQDAHWTFLSNHAHVLVCLARDPRMRLRDAAGRVGVTERAVQKIVADLERAGVLTRSREGRRNRYDIHTDAPLRHPVEGQRTVRDLLAALLAADELAALERPSPPAEAANL